MKYKSKRICAGILAVTLLSVAILPHIGKKETKAFQGQFGVCIDYKGSSANHYYHKSDTYTNKLKDMNVIEETYGYNSPEYKEALAYNVEMLRKYLGSDENALKVFWSGVATWLTGGISGYGDMKEVQYWADYVEKGYQDSMSHGYAPALPSYTLHPMTEAELGRLLHNNGNDVIERDPLLKMLTNPDTFFNPDWEKMPQALPRLCNAWLNSYKDFKTGEVGYALWPADLVTHTVGGGDGWVPTKEQVQLAALDMETNPNYWYGVNIDGPDESGPSGGPSMQADGDEDGLDEDDGSEDETLPGNTSNKTMGKNPTGEYWIDMKEVFFGNFGLLKIWDDTKGAWEAISPATHYQQTVNIMGWDIYLSADNGHWYCWFKWAGEGTPSSLVMYFEIPQNAAPDVNAKGFDTPIEFVARYLRLFMCESCSSGVAKERHQRHISFYHDKTSWHTYPCLRLGGTDPIPTMEEADSHFCIYRHTEDWDSNYNVQLNKYDYETGKPLEGSIFNLYERFDDKEEVNRNRDGAVQLYEGIDNDSDQEWQSKYTSSPVIWENFRFVDSYATDEKGHIETNLKKNYHYEKTFCDGHPIPQFVEIPESDEEDENDDAAEAAKNANKEEANKWLTYYNACVKMAEEDRPGVHFHWEMEGVDPNAIEAVAASGEPGGLDSGVPTQCSGVDEAYEKSGCQQDCEDTYDKFIHLKYSYTWVEERAREGYIRHDLHTDDVPIEIITTNSSEAGAKSDFANQYSKEIEEEEIETNENMESRTIRIPFDEEEDIGSAKIVSQSQNLESDMVGIKDLLSDAFCIKAYASDKTDLQASDTETKSILDAVKIEAFALFTEREKEPERENFNYENETENIDFNDYEIEFDTATSSNINSKKLDESIFDSIRELASSNRSKSRIPMIYLNDNESQEGAEAYQQIYEKAFTDSQTGGEGLEIGPDDNWSHCNDVDGEDNTWRVYDHRTEGEIHFNKRDMDLAAKENDSYNAYADANGDGKMEGAVYGLFAKRDIVHPDGKTGTIFKANNLVAIATTDRNGDGSFMVITEAPGSIYNYDTGKVERTNWYGKAPGNLYRTGARSSGVQPDVLFSNGEKTNWFCDDYTEDGMYKGGLTQRLYDNNEENNGDSWIGRPLFMGEYYIKELSRSEGYELSINGKLNAITNFGADINTTEITENGSVRISKNLYIQGQETVGEANEPFFEVTSEGTTENGGYDIVLTQLPEGAKIYRHDQVTKKGTFQAVDHYEYIGKTDENGNPVYKTANTTGIPILKGDGTNDVLTEEKNAKYYLNGINAVNVKTFDETKILAALKGEAQIGPDGNSRYPEFETLQQEFRMGQDSTYYIRFVKYKLEQALRTSGITTPNGKYVENGASRKKYSEIEVPYYARGIREGEIDRYGVSGAAPGTVATKTIYGPQIVNIEIGKQNSEGNNLTNGDMVYNLLQYYMDHPYWNFGGIDRIEENGDHYNIYLYAHNTMYANSFAVLGETEEDTIIYRRLEFNPNDTSFEPYVVYVPYTSTESEKSFGTYSGLSIKNTFGSVKVTAILEPDAVIDRDGNIHKKMVTVAKTYAVGDIIHDKNGKPEQELTPKPVYVDKEIDELEMAWTEVPARYEDGKYIIHMNMPETDAFGNVISDSENQKTFEFKAVVPKKDIVLTQEDVYHLPSRYSLQVGDKMSSGTYEVEVQKAKAYVYLDYEIYKESNDDSFIKEVILSYPSDEYVFQDGDGNPGTGTRRNPIRILERPIRQKIKIVKDIQTIPELEEYLYDTYSEVHKENLSKDGKGRWHEKATDWLSSFLDGEIENESASKLPEFRFKVYLKSNLERLYRDSNGSIVWLDRNGNPLVPEYQDTNYDGNYETFVWRNGNTVMDFPEKSIMDGYNCLESANVQKFYTKVEHNRQSTTTGDISNNVWAEYEDPQTGETRNVGEMRGYCTSQDGDNGVAVKTNSSLYSYDDRNINVVKSDKINQNANVGYTRLLESTVSTIEDGAGKTREVEIYNYEKFFDAMIAANTDKWDNDMYTSTKNYPGQHWFETFQEKYQMDDADPDRTLANVDGTDADGSAGGDRDTSFKPFSWIREKLFGASQESMSTNPAVHDNGNLENKINTSNIAHKNAEASDMVRQFAIKWYHTDEVAKLVKNNGFEEDVTKSGHLNYQEEIYDRALEQALIKAYHYLKPFYEYDLDSIYAVEWDSEENGGSDGDVTTLSTDTLYDVSGMEREQGESKNGYYYGVSAYLPYGTYVAVEQQPFREDLDDFDNKHYKTDKPKEITLPAVYEEGGNVGTPEIFNSGYNYDSKDTPEELTGKYMIRFNEEWAKNHTDDLRNYVIRAHGYDGDYEVYKYGLDVDKLIGKISYEDGEYTYAGCTITQDENDPLKNYYNSPLVNTPHDGGNEDSHYLADDENPSINTASGIHYEEDAIEKRYHYGSISENAGTAKDVLYQDGGRKEDDNPSGFYFKDNVKTMTGNQTAYEGKYASMLVPWSVVEPVDSISYDITNYTGYADGKYRNTFYTTKLRVEKVDSETGEQLLHDDAIFSIYAASRYTNRAEIEKAGAPAGTEIGDVKFYMEDTMITGSKEFLMSMGAWNIEPVMRGRSVGIDELYSGMVVAGTPVCVEDEQIIMEDMLGNKTGRFKVYTTLNDIKALNEEDPKNPADKGYVDQNTGYFITPQPLGAGVYVVTETKAPTGYARSKPIAVEIYSDGVSYYMNGLMDSKVESTIYQGNLINP